MLNDVMLRRAFHLCQQPSVKSFPGMMIGLNHSDKRGHEYLERQMLAGSVADREPSLGLCYTDQYGN